MAYETQTFHLGLLLYYKDTSQNSQMEELQRAGWGEGARSLHAFSGRPPSQHLEALCPGVLYGVFIMQVQSVTGDWTQLQLFSPPW